MVSGIYRVTGLPEIPFDLQPYQAVKERHIAPLKFFKRDIKRQIRDALKQDPQGDFSLQPGKGRTQTIMDSLPKGDVWVLFTMNIQGRGGGKLRFVTIGRAQDHDD